MRDELRAVREWVGGAEAVLRRVRADIQRRMMSDDATDAPYDEDLSLAIGAIDKALGDGPSKHAGYATLEEAQEAPSTLTSTGDEDG